LNGALEEEIYMSQPEGFIVKRQEKKICKLEQASKQCHQKFNRVIVDFGFTINKYDKCI